MGGGRSHVAYRPLNARVPDVRDTETVSCGGRRRSYVMWGQPHNVVPSPGEDIRMASLDLPTVIDFGLAALGVTLLWAPELMQRMLRMVHRVRRRKV